MSGKLCNLMYAVIKTGGKQEKVAEGQRVDVELLHVAEGDEVGFDPVLLVDGDDVVAGSALAGARVSGRVVGESKGPKIKAFTYKAKNRARKRWGHRQHYTTVEITGITRGSGGS